MNKTQLYRKLIFTILLPITFPLLLSACGASPSQTTPAQDQFIITSPTTSDAEKAWSFAQQKASSPLMQLAGDGAIADLSMNADAKAELDLSHFSQVLVLIHKGAIHLPTDTGSEIRAGQLAIVDSRELLQLQAGAQGAGLLILAGNKINEKIVHRGPFVMNTQAQMEQTIRDYQSGKFGKIA